MPKRVDHEQRRRQIAGALLRIAEERGLQHASMREVAAAAGVSVRLVQYYFHTKDELLLGALTQLGEELGERMTRHIRALGSPPSPRDVVYGTLTAILPTDPDGVRLARSYAAFYSLVLAEPHLARHGTSYPDRLEELLARQLAAVEVADAGIVAAGLLAMTNGLVSSVLGGQRPVEAARTILHHHLDRVFPHP